MTCRKAPHPTRDDAVAAARKILRASFDLGAVAGLPVHALPATWRRACLALGSFMQGESAMSKSEEVYDGKRCAVCEELILAVDSVRYLSDTGERVHAACWD